MKSLIVKSIDLFKDQLDFQPYFFATLQSSTFLGVPSKNFLLFIVPSDKQKLPEDFSFHYDVIYNLKQKFKKDITLLVDTCLCSVTPDGHCGISHKMKIDLKQTHYALGLAANTYLEAGADIIAPRDMMKNTTR